MFPYAQRQTAESGDEMFDLMKKFMMKKFLKKFSEDGAADDFFGGEKKRNVSSGFFKKKLSQIRPLFVYFRSFQNAKTNIAQISQKNDKSIDDVRKTRTQGSRMDGRYKSTEPLQHPQKSSGGLNKKNR